MPIAAPRLDVRLADELKRLARTDVSYADIRRALVRRAHELWLAPPSYEHVRRLVLAERELRAGESEYADQLVPVIVGVALGIEHGSELARVARGEDRRRRRGTAR